MAYLLRIRGYFSTAHTPAMMAGEVTSRYRR
jgi:hypothetical protein